MNNWQRFLNSLSTPGGNLLLLAVFVFALFLMVVHVLENPHPNGDQSITVILSTFSAFSGALLQALRGRSSDVNAVVVKSNGGNNDPAPKIPVPPSNTNSALAPVDTKS